MKNIAFIALVSLLSGTVHSQARIVINNDGFIVIDNSAFIVLENDNPNALTTLGTGGNIVSENEADVIKWEIGQTTGNYVIPWTTTPVSQGGNGTKIPLEINKTTTGVGANSEFILSTYETATDLNVAWPSGVTNMNLPIGGDGSLSVADRFWHINALSYTAKPDIILSIGYDPAANEIAGTNTILESNLLAQRFNTTLNDWQLLMFGVNDAANDRVTGINIPAADFFEDFILVDQVNPLPIELVTFDVLCEDRTITLNWTTASESNNDFFTIERSFDGQNFTEIDQVDGAGNSINTLSYNWTDPNPVSGNVYYRLKQTDFDGAIKYSDVVFTNCLQVTEVSIFPNPAKDHVTIVGLNESDLVTVISAEGKLVFHDISNGNAMNINTSIISTGAYFICIQQKDKTIVKKLIIQ